MGLFLISSASVRSISFLSFIEPIFACPLGISNFLEEISGVSHSIAFISLALGFSSAASLLLGTCRSIFFFYGFWGFASDDSLHPKIYKQNSCIFYPCALSAPLYPCSQAEPSG